ncbi:MAG: hypothetical protein EAY65_00065 [Alphaproteobacteria bacterium]|nr:MAG: hypothetical protein EAY65_00065 [Alphaproteobacteria bacterium]
MDGPSPMSANMAMFQQMQQMHATPGERFLCFPALDYSVGMPNGLMNYRIGPPLFSSLSGGKFGPLSALGNSMSRCFVDIGTLMNWSMAGVEQHSNITPAHIETPHIEAPHIQGASIDAPHISAPEIRAAAASAGFQDMGGAPIEAPRGVGTRPSVAMGMDM